ncbi:hypothetical protein [Ruegeria arenilitoris]|uniref:hypothetical protein n=1 Tax=Ruegeria arenilitoris TaxID=1173585 RepID=UPI0014814980|nr:hypothetical protein [Ruegeria arenilitoris]
MTDTQNAAFVIVHDSGQKLRLNHEQAKQLQLILKKALLRGASVGLLMFNASTSDFNCRKRQYEF